MSRSKPNIEGSAKYPLAVLPKNPYLDGALKTEIRVNSGSDGAAGSGYKQTTISLIASNADATYSGEKLQPSALQALVCIKT